MLNIMLATSRPEILNPFAKALASDPEVHLDQVASGADALGAVRASFPHLLIIDAGLPDTTPLRLAAEVLMVNAMVNTAVLSPLSEPEFHEASEGLGVLGRLPLEPGPSDAADLLRKLRSVLGQTG